MAMVGLTGAVSHTPFLDPKGKQGGLAALLPTCLPGSPMELFQVGTMDTSEES